MIYVEAAWTTCTACVYVTTFADYTFMHNMCKDKQSLQGIASVAF